MSRRKKFSFAGLLSLNTILAFVAVSQAVSVSLKKCQALTK